MSYERYERENATPEDQLAWLLCQIIDWDDAPLRWTRYRGAAVCLLGKTNNLRDIVKQYDSAPDRQEPK